MLITVNFWAFSVFTHKTQITKNQQHKIKIIKLYNRL